MMDRETALNTLRLSAHASRADIIDSYARLARRYPLQQFPERHTRLLEAKTALLSPESAFKDMLFEEIIDLHWLNRYSSKGETNQSSASVDGPHPKQCLEALFRPILKMGLDLFPVNDSMTEFAQLLDEISPEGLQDLIESFLP